MKKFSQNFYKSFSIIETFKKKKREKILFPLILLPPFRHLYSLFISNQLQVANAWSIQQLLRANKSPRFFLSSSQYLYNAIFSRFIASSLLLESREYQSWEGTGRLSIIFIIACCSAKSWKKRGILGEDNRGETLFGIIRGREQLFFPRVQGVGDGTMVRKMALRSSAILTNKGKNRSDGLFSNRWRYCVNFSPIAFQSPRSINIREKNEEYARNSNCKCAFV